MPLSTVFAPTRHTELSWSSEVHTILLQVEILRYCPTVGLVMVDQHPNTQILSLEVVEGFQYAIPSIQAVYDIAERQGFCSPIVSVIQVHCLE